ncbi:hypothetical protein GBAR_LOCUS18388 [Geodia barretti]|uniref:Uncharacterized protein n=1 Tax=Geodia barretti TaxID=519541 RepID=A0AA35WXM3_GEOBA|nr:hypothetical protein GBAR_LOCUS18388 [Geodia barretti]
MPHPFERFCVERGISVPDARAADIIDYLSRSGSRRDRRAHRRKIGECALRACIDSCRPRAGLRTNPAALSSRRVRRALHRSRSAVEVDPMLAAVDMGHRRAARSGVVSRGSIRCVLRSARPLAAGDFAASGTGFVTVSGRAGAASVAADGAALDGYSGYLRDGRPALARDASEAALFSTAPAVG